MKVHDFCVDCEEFVDAEVEPFRETRPIRGIEITVESEFPVCPKCGARICSAEYVDASLCALYARYRELADIPAAQEITDIRKRYGLSQAVFAKILGIGVASVQRYEKGSLPTESHAELLRSARSKAFLTKRLMARPAGLDQAAIDKAIEKLGGVSENISYYCIPWDATDALNAFSLLGASDASGSRAFDARRMAGVACYLADAIEDLFVTKFNKALFYLDFLCFKERGYGFTGLRYIRLPYGPVPNDYEQLCAGLVLWGAVEVSEKGDGQVLLPVGCADEGLFSGEDKALLRRVAQFCNSFRTTHELSERSHEERAWRETPTGHVIDYRFAKSLSLG